jgi:sulfur transfer protein SufE
MNIVINSINLKLKDGDLVGANVYFTGKEDTVNVSGHIPLTADEYDGKTYTELESLVKTKVIEKLSPSE